MLKAHTWCKNFFTPRASTARGAAMTLEEVRQYIRDLDAKDCPVAKRARELREAKLEQARRSVRPASSSGRQRIFPRAGGTRSINASASTSCKILVKTGP